MTIKITIEANDRFSEETHCIALEQLWERGQIDIPELLADSTSMTTTFEVVDLS
ncbi:MAG TPA: hypothetical protein VJQ25_14450 [Nitrospira sp.]|nr:hypothetical protein [Nitrospira sp.]